MKQIRVALSVAMLACIGLSSVYGQGKNLDVTVEPQVIPLKKLDQSDLHAKGLSTFSSTDVPKAMPDDDASGITSVLSVPAEGKVIDVNLVLTQVTHTCVADLHIELTAPSGLNVPLVLAFTEAGILTGLGCPDDFTNTVFDDEALVNLAAGAGPYTGSFNVDHVSVGNDPLGQFVDQPTAGTWTLFMSDLAEDDTGSLDAWALEIEIATAVPTMSRTGYFILAVMLAALGFVVLVSRMKQASLRR